MIKTLVDNLFLDERITEDSRVERAIWEREALSPTMLGFGITIPHCKSDGVLNNSISIMKLAQPILWNEGDDILTDTVFMLTVKASEAGSTHMKIFAQLARRIMRAEFRERVKSTSDKTVLLNSIRDELAL